MAPLYWILLVPLAFAWGWTLWRLLHERELRLLIPAGLLPLMAIRHLVSPPAPGDDLTELLLDQRLESFLLDLVINVAAAGAAMAFCASVRDRNRAEHVQWTSMEALRRLSDLLTSKTGGSEPDVEEILELGCQEIGLEIGVLSILDGSQCEVAAILAPGDCVVSEGDRFDLDATFCAGAVGQAEPLCIESAAQGPWLRHPAREIHQLECYIGTAIRHRGEVLGTLYFAGREPRPRRFTRVHKTLLEVMAQRLSSRLRDRLEARQQREREQLQRTVADLTRLDPAADDFLAAAASRIGDGLRGWRVEIHRSSVAGQAAGIVASAGSGEPVTDAKVVRLPIALAEAGVGELLVWPPADCSPSPDEQEMLELAANLIARSVAGRAGPAPVAPSETPRPEAGGATARRTTTASASPSTGWTGSRGERRPRRRTLDLHWALSRLAGELAEAPEGWTRIDLDLASERLELPLYRFEVDRIVGSLIRHAGRTQPGQALRIETRAVAPPDPSTADRYVELSIHAPGAGLSSQQLQGLYATTGSPDAGDALSLQRVEQLLRDAGGDLSVRSEAGGGTTFTAYFALGPHA